MNQMLKHEEWFFQSDYDLETASDMFDSKRNVYCIFMCHLSLEKALKGLFVKRKNEFPPKSHSLIYFVEKINIELTKDNYEFLFTLNKMSVPTRYPDDLRKLFSAFNEVRTAEILSKTRVLQSWIKQQ
jgi:HEPN domain-containing protein